MNKQSSLSEKLLVGATCVPLLLGVGENSPAINKVVEGFTARLKTMFASIELSPEELDKLKICCGDACGDGPTFDQEEKFKNSKVGLFVQFSAGNYGVNFDTHPPVRGGVSFQNQAEICADKADKFVSTDEKSSCYGIKGIVITEKQEDKLTVSLACADQKNPSFKIEK